MKNTISNPITLSFLLVFTILMSCKQEKKEIKNTPTQTLQDSTTMVKEEKTPEKDYSKFGFPNSGSSLKDFENKDYEIQYDASGDLNGDKIADAALVLKKRGDTLSPRIFLVLLKDKNNIFHLDQVSKNAIPPEYNEYEYKIYDTEDINIFNGNLTVNFYGLGASGNLSFSYKYLNSQLKLIYIESFAAGAGSQQSLEYEPLKGIFTQSVTNTMEEDMLTKSKSIKLKPQIFLFENANPDEIISKIYSEYELLST